MALCKTIQQTIFGTMVENAYHRVEGLSFADKNTIRFSVRPYASQAAADGGFASLGGGASYDCTYDAGAGDPYAQAYLYLKTQEEFATSTDC